MLQRCASASVEPTLVLAERKNFHNFHKRFQKLFEAIIVIFKIHSECDTQVSRAGRLTTENANVTAIEDASETPSEVANKHTRTYGKNTAGDTAGTRMWNVHGDDHSQLGSSCELLEAHRHGRLFSSFTWSTMFRSTQTSYLSFQSKRCSSILRILNCEIACVSRWRVSTDNGRC